MDARRPFTDPVSVSLAGLTLLALAAGSFTNALARKLNLPNAVEGASVVVMPPSDAPPSTPVPALARLEAAAPAPKLKAAPRPPPAELEPTPTPLEIGPAPAPATAAPEVADDAAATGAAQSEPQEPPPPPEEVPAY